MCTNISWHLSGAQEACSGAARAGLSGPGQVKAGTGQAEGLRPMGRAWCRGRSTPRVGPAVMEGSHVSEGGGRGSEQRPRLPHTLPLVSLPCPAPALPPRPATPVLLTTCSSFPPGTVAVGGLLSSLKGSCSPTCVRSLAAGTPAPEGGRGQVAPCGAVSERPQAASACRGRARPAGFQCIYPGSSSYRRETGDMRGGPLRGRSLLAFSGRNPCFLRGL